MPEELGFAIEIAEIDVTECDMVNQFAGSHDVPPQFTRGYGLAFGHAERKAMAMALVDRALRAEELSEAATSPAQDEEFVLAHSDNVEASGFVQHLKLPHYVDFQSELVVVRALRAEVEARRAAGGPRPGSGVSDAENSAKMAAYNYAYLDEQTKRMIRRAILKAVAVPGYQVPFGGREMPLPYGWGTGGIQVTAAIIGRDDTLKVIDQGADDTTNAVSIRRFFATRGRGRHDDAHRGGDHHPDAPSRAGDAAAAKARSWSSRCRSPSRCACSSRARPRRARCTRSSEYGVMQVSLYESIARHGRIAKTYNYPVMVNGRYMMSPSPIPKFDNPKLDRSPALQLYGAGREKRIYAVPPYTPVKSLDFDDHPFEIETWERVLRAVRLQGELPRRDDRRRRRQAAVRLLRHRLLRTPAHAGGGGGMKPLLCRPAPVRARPHQALRRARRLPRRRASTCGPARCWASWANRARARPRC